jgi:hypothetical protein
MKKTTVRLNDQVYSVLEHTAAKRELSLNQLINYALVRFVSFEEAFQMLEERAQQARPGAMRKVFRKTAAHDLPPLHPEDHRPMSFNRRALDKRIAREATLSLKVVGR